MAQLAIKGHPTRGKEVIEILKMLGGRKEKNLGGSELFCWYYINENGDIDYKHYSLFTNTKVFTLEEFLKKFPYKVGDKVTLNRFSSTIKGMSWDCDDVLYYVQGVDFSKGVYSKDKDLQPYKKETMKKT